MYAQDQSLVINNLAVSLCDTIIIVLCCTCQPFAALCVKLHGPIHGGLQHCVSDVQQKTAAGQQHGTALIYIYTQLLPALMTSCTLLLFIQLTVYQQIDSMATSKEEEDPVLCHLPRQYY